MDQYNHHTGQAAPDDAIDSPAVSQGRPATPPGELRAARPREIVDVEAVAFVRSPSTGDTIVTAPGNQGETVYVGTLRRIGNQWHAHDPYGTRQPGKPGRTRHDVLIRLLESHYQYKTRRR